MKTIAHPSPLTPVSERSRTTPLTPMIHTATIEDLPTIVEIYNSSIAGRMATADLEPVTVASRLEWFNGHTPDRRPLWTILVPRGEANEVDGKIGAWLSLRSFYGRDAYRHTAEVSVYVSPDYHRQHLGDQLLTHAIASCPSLDINTLVGFIFGHNQPSLNLFKKHKFQQWGFLPQIAELNGIERDLVILGRKT
jgi:L-amino acid N-acyltransferase YncA